MNRLASRFLALTALLCAPSTYSQELGHYLQGAAGLDGGSMAPPGFYAAFIPYFNIIDSVKGPNGRTVISGNHLNISAYNALLSGTVKTNFLGGATYGYSLIVPILNERVFADILPSGGFARYGVSDIYFSPLQLGWTKGKFDILTNYGFYAPVGDYDPTRATNQGLGFWEHQIQLGTTYHIDKLKKWSAAVMTTWEINMTKSSEAVKPGPGMTAEFGFGRRFLSYRLNIGIAASYYRKLGLDSGADVTRAFYDQAASAGPEVTYLAPKWHMQFTARYEPQFEVRGRTSGQVFWGGITYLAPSH